MSAKPNVKVVVDTREQDPWEFENLESASGTLQTGDYSIVGLEHLVAIERKSLPDLLGCIGSDRDRFKRELQRLRAYRFRLLVVEATSIEIEAGDWRSKLHPNHVLGSLAAWQAQFGLPVWLGGSHASSAEFAERFLYQCARQLANEASAVAPLLSQEAVTA